MNVLLFIIVLVGSFIIVRIGAIALQLTGLEWSLAKFQALSCFTSTGFTTKEAELITSSPQRRRIASVLIILGHAGLVTMIATFANSLRPDMIAPKFTIPFLHLVIPSRLLPWVNLGIIAIVTYIVYKIFVRSRIARMVTNALRSRIKKKDIIKPVLFEELVVATGGYGVSSIEICKNSPILDETIAEAKLRSYDITILAIERGGETIPNPPASTKIILEDRLICFGKLENIKNTICVIPTIIK